MKPFCVHFFTAISFLLGFVKTLCAETPITTSPGYVLMGESYATPVLDNPEYTLQVLRQGYPIGDTNVVKRVGNALSKESIGLDKVAEKMQELNNSMLKDLGAYANRSQEALAQLPTSLEPKTDLAPVSGKPPTQVLEYNLDKFLKCIDGTLPNLLTLRRLALQNEQAFSVVLDEEIAKERGNGTEVSSGGVACGKYLGSKGFTSPGSIDEIKTILAIQRLDGQSQKTQMLNLLALKMTGKGSREPKGGIAEEFWQYSWRQASLEAVFGEKQFDLQTMLDQFRQYLQKNNPNSSAVLVGFHISDNRWSDFSQGIRAQWKEVNEL